MHLKNTMPSVAVVAILASCALPPTAAAGPVIGENPHTGEKIRLKTDHPAFAYLGAASISAENVEKVREGLLAATPDSLTKPKALSAFCKNYLGLKTAEGLSKADIKTVSAVLLKTASALSRTDRPDPKALSAYCQALAILRKEGHVNGKQFVELAGPVKAVLFAEGAVNPKVLGRRGNLASLVDLLWDSPALSKEEEWQLREAAYGGLTPHSGSCNNGRWGWIRHWAIAAAFSDAGLAAKVLDDFAHWLAHDLYPSGAPLDFISYDYSHRGKPGVLDSLAGFMDGLDPQTYKVPSFPAADRFHRDGFADTRDPRRIQNVLWRGIDLYHGRYKNMAMPDRTYPGINDTNPTVAQPDDPKQHARRLASPDCLSLGSRNAASSAILYSGAANRSYLWDEPVETRSDPAVIDETFAAYLHADTSCAVHNHYDINQLILWRYGKMLADDNGGSVGARTFTYDRKLGAYGMKTYAHNTVVVDQRCQFIGDGRTLDFGEVPGFKVATADAGYAWKNTNHRRLIALCDEYLLDLNLLFPVEGTPEEAHTFDYMFQTFGNSYETSLTKKDVHRARSSYHGQNWPSEPYLQWPNLIEIYPYIRWDEFHPYQAKRSWHVTASEDGVSLRTHFLLRQGEEMKAMLGMANLNIRGRYRLDKMLLGVPKICARKEGGSADFLVLHDAYRDQPHVTEAVRLDERAARVSLSDGATDWVLAERSGGARHLLARAAGGRLVALRVIDLAEVRFGGQTLLAASQAGAGVNASLDYGENALRVYATCDSPVRLLIRTGTASASVTSDGRSVPTELAKGLLVVELKPGVNRLQVTTDSTVRIPVKASELDGLPLQFPLRPVKTEDDRFALDTSKVAWQRVYRRPRIYADGAYKAIDGINLWATAISDDAEVAVLGTHENCIECVAKDGAPRWRFYMDGRAVCDYWGPTGGWNGIGFYARPLSISSDGNRIAAITEKGTVYVLDRNGQLQWKDKVEGWGYSATLSRQGDRLAVASDNEWVLYDAEGKVLFRQATDGASGLDAAVSPSGNRSAFTDMTGNLRVIDRDGRELWKWNPVELGTPRSLKEGSHWFAVPKGKVHLFDVRLSRDGEKVVVSTSNAWLIALDGKGKVLWKRQEFDEQLRELAVSDDGKRIAAGGGGGGVYYYDGNGKRLWMYQNPFAAFFISMTPDGRYISTLCPTGAYYLLSGDGKVVTRTPLLTPEPMVSSITPDGRYTLAAGIGFDAYLFENQVK